VSDQSYIVGTKISVPSLFGVSNVRLCTKI
jgi:hypothetical protein